jgi:membrane protease YdiL (CAAX protease family)
MSQLINWGTKSVQGAWSAVRRFLPDTETIRRRHYENDILVIGSILATTLFPSDSWSSNPLIVGSLSYGLTELMEHSSQVVQGCQNVWRSVREKTSDACRFVHEKIPVQPIVNHFAGGSIFAFVSNQVMQPLMRNNFDVRTHFPSFLHSYSQMSCKINRSISMNLDMSYFIAFTGPVLEEFSHRIILQELLLKRIPAALLKKVAPSHTSMINGSIAKVSRIAISSAIFALTHAVMDTFPNNSAVYIAHKFLLGAILGSIQEITGNPLLPIAFHIGNNIGLSSALYGQPILCTPDDMRQARLNLNAMVEDYYWVNKYL